MHQRGRSRIVVIGASTGGPGVIEKLLAALPHRYPHPICIVQHFPVGLSSSFVSRLQTLTSNRVVESRDHLRLEAGMIVVARGGVHMNLSCSSPGEITVRETVAEQGYRSDFVPSVDDLFISAARSHDMIETLAILLTGIGDDGAEGLMRIALSGGITVCQSESSCPVFGMPARAIEKGAARYVFAPEEIINMIAGFGA